MKTTSLRIFLFLVILAPARHVPAQTVLRKIYVAPHLVKCTPDGHNKCMLYKDSTDTEWKVLNGNIEGFHYREGNEYELLVEAHGARNATADSSVTTHFALSRIVSEQKMLIHPKYRLDDEPWFLVKVKSGKSVKHLDKLDVFLIINTDEGKISGHSGCNKFTGTVTVSDSSIKIGAISATKMQCSGTINQMENDFLHQLPQSTTYMIKDNQLYLFEDTKLLLVFRRK
jgi:heat shock protein HslJ